MPRPTPERYRPGIIPDTVEGLIPFLFDELYRIAVALYQHIVGCTVEVFGEQFAVSTTPQWHQLFIGAPAIGDLPGGAWKQAQGAYIAPESGLYQISLNSRVAPFGSGNKTYNVSLELRRALQPGAPQVPIWRTPTSGQDDLELGAALSVGVRLVGGNEITVWLQSEHDQFTGNISVDSYLSINQTSAE